MSETFRIGDYKIESRELYQILKEDGITSNKQLKKLDKDKDKIVTEDEFIDVDIDIDDTDEDIDETDTLTDDDDTSGDDDKSSSHKTGNAKIDEQLDELQDNYDKQLLELYKKIDELEEKRRKSYSSMGSTKDKDKMSSALSEAQSATTELQNLRKQIVSLTSTLEEQIKKLEEAAEADDKAKAKQAALNLRDSKTGTFNVDTSNGTSTPSVNASDVNFNFTENLDSSQQSALEQFKSHYEQNKSRYQSVSQKTGIPAELIAAIHWREASGSFDARLHDGGPLGEFSSWEESAIDALKGYSVTNDISTWYDMAERYNGLGYRNKGVSSPYVWAGTTNYTSGKYVADGVYDSGHVDKQLGVAVMLKALLGK